jgi:hypothetical protein
MSEIERLPSGSTMLWKADLDLLKAPNNYFGVWLRLTAGTYLPKADCR